MNTPFLPRTVRDMLAVLTSHYDGWNSNAAAIGLSGPQLLALKAAMTATTERVDAADAARVKSKTATLDMNDSAETLRTLAQQALDRIRLFAESSANPTAVYILAEVPPPAPPSPTPAPEAPTSVVADPNADGTVTVGWRGSTARGAFFTIWRRVGVAGPWTQIGAVAAKRFTDFAVPNPGLTDGATLFYGLRTQRNVEVSPMSVPATVSYGAAPGFAAIGNAVNAGAQGGKLAA